MGATRMFVGSRGGTSLTSLLTKKIRRQELRKGGSLNYNSTEKYKMLLSMKMDAHRQKSQMNAYSTFMLKGAETTEKKLSRRTELILKEMASKKAAKEAKALRQRVVIKPRWYSNVGYINKQGVVYDKMNNITLKVNVKNGKIKAVNGWHVGKYKAGSMWHDSWMMSWIKKYSPYELQLQKYEMQRQLQHLQNLQQQGGMVTVHGAQVDPAVLMAQMQQQMDAFGNAIHHTDSFGNTVDAMGNHVDPNHDRFTSIGRNNVDVSAWGVRSNNVFGTFGENAWGGYADNIWGGNFNNAWGGIGDPGPGLWGGGRPGRNLFNSSMGNGKNYLAVWGKGLFRALGFGRARNRVNGLNGRLSSSAAQALIRGRRTGPSGTSRGSSGARRSGGPPSGRSGGGRR